MEEYLLSHILDLARQSKRKGKTFFSDFLGVSEQGSLANILQGETIEGTPFLSFGGHQEAERKMIVFFPSEGEKQAFLEEEELQKEGIRCIKLTPRYKKEEKELGHRDYLGALMSLGIKRENIGDIFYEGSLCYLYLSPLATEEVLSNLDSVGRVPIQTEEVSLSSCTLFFHKEEIRLSVSSLRLDNVLSSIAHLSREEAKNCVLGERVHLSLHPNPKPDTILLPSERVSVEGWGKFLFLEEIGISKKGKSVILIEKFL